VGKVKAWSAPCLHRSNLLSAPSSEGSEAMAITTEGGRNRRGSSARGVLPTRFCAEAVSVRASRLPSPIGPGGGEAHRRASLAARAQDSQSRASLDIVALPTRLTGPAEVRGGDPGICMCPAARVAGRSSRSQLWLPGVTNRPDHGAHRRQVPRALLSEENSAATSGRSGTP
jgi:hypothetical protein